MTDSLPECSRRMNVFWSSRTADAASPPSSSSGITRASPPRPPLRTPRPCRPRMAPLPKPGARRETHPVRTSDHASVRADPASREIRGRRRHSAVADRSLVPDSRSRDCRALGVVEPGRIMALNVGRWWKTARYRAARAVTLGVPARRNPRQPGRIPAALQVPARSLRQSRRSDLQRNRRLVGFSLPGIRAAPADWWAASPPSRRAPSSPIPGRWRAGPPWRIYPRRASSSTALRKIAPPAAKRRSSPAYRGGATATFLSA